MGQIPRSIERIYSLTCTL